METDRSCALFARNHFFPDNLLFN